jgi:hypothetical protein
MGGAVIFSTPTVGKPNCANVVVPDFKYATRLDVDRDGCQLSGVIMAILPAASVLSVGKSPLNRYSTARNTALDELPEISNCTLVWGDAGLGRIASTPVVSFRGLARDPEFHVQPFLL